MASVVRIPRLSDAQRLEVRRRVAAGETFEEAAAGAGCSVPSVRRVMARSGGMKPRLKLRSPLRLSLAEREEISRGLLIGRSMRAIGLLLGRSTSTVTREVAANGHRQRYRAWRAEKTAIRKARRPKVAKLVRCRRLRAEVERLLTEDGRRSRSRIVCYSIILTTRRCGCPTRPSTAPCSSMSAVPFAKSSPPTFGAAASNDALSGVSLVAESKTW